MTDKRTIYLKTVSIPEALEQVQTSLDRGQLIRPCIVPTEQALGRVTCEPVYARFSSPTFHSAAMDGIAVRAESTFAAREGRPVELTLGQDYVEVNTGAPMPEDMDAVVMIEQVTAVAEGRVRIEQPVFPWQHVRKIGEDIVATEMLLPRNHRVTAYDIGALLSGGIWELSAWERVRIRFIPTGDEVLDFTARPSPRPGQVVESNSQVMAAMAAAWGCDFTRVPPVPDNRDSLEQAVRAALEDGVHVVVIGAGSSAGSKDFTSRVLTGMGRVLVHGIAAMPGKPTILGEIEGRLVVGAPGYPVSSVVCFEHLVEPLVAWLQRRPPLFRDTVSVRLTRSVPSKLGREEFVRVAVGRVGGTFVATPLARGAGMITTMTKAQAVLRIPMNSEGEEAGSVLEAELLVDRPNLEQTLVAVGSHDNTLDLIGDTLMGLSDPVRLSSAHVGSLGGLRALREGAAHLAGAHLFDPESGDFNFPFLRQMLPDVPVQVVNLAFRHQGPIVPKGNPGGISSSRSLADKGLPFVNRQPGAGTRILLDHHLELAGVSPGDVAGYDREEYTHMAVAVNVMSGAADCGMGIASAAKALDLGFVPLARERYDLVIPRQHLDDPKVQALLTLLQEEEFKSAIRGLGGYETHLTGRIMEPGQGLG